MKRPNILIMMCDQLNAGVLGAYGGPVPTPNIDALAEEGVLFTHAMCPTPFCSPSRASMITGVYPHEHGITYNVNRRDYPWYPTTPETEEGIRRADVTTEKLLDQSGYDTHHYGKWHLLDEDLPYYTDMFREHGTYERLMEERFAAVEGLPRDQWMNWYNWRLPVDPSDALRKAVDRLGPEWGVEHHREFISKMGRLDFPPELTFDHMVADRGIRLLEQLGEAPFMLTCSFNYPHDPNVVPSPYYEMFDPDEIVLPADRYTREPRCESQWSRQIVADLGEVGLREFLRVYYAAVKLIDVQVGRVLQALEESGRAEDTLVLFTADHGDMCGGHGMVWKSTDMFYDEVVQVPLIVRYPGIVAPARLDMVCNLTDIMPTLLDFAGHEIPEHVQGSSLAPYLCGECSADDAPTYTFSERIPANPGKQRSPVNVDKGSYMIRSQDWKYCRYAGGDEMLFDLQNDPKELTNLAGQAQYKEIQKTLAYQLAAWLRAKM